MILSLDVGIKNCSYCLVDSTGRIHDWGLLDFSGGKNCNTLCMITIARNIRHVMREKFFDLLLGMAGEVPLIKEVVIENQSGPNSIRMKSIQSMLTMYFLNIGVSNVQYISPKNKLKKFDVPKKSYADRKKSSVMVTNLLIENPEVCGEDLRIYFRESCKKDDLADAFLQIRYFLGL